MKKIFKKRSKLLGFICLLESILSIWYLSYFNYIDRLSYDESVNTNSKNIVLLFQDMYTSTFWRLIILIICLITISSIISFIYRDTKFQLISCILWLVMLILAINIKDTFINNLSTLAIFTPIIGINILALVKQKNILK